MFDSIVRFSLRNRLFVLAAALMLMVYGGLRDVLSAQQVLLPVHPSPSVR